MHCFDYWRVPRRIILIAITGSALMYCSMSMATEAPAAESLSVPEKSLPGPIGVAVSGGSAGITTGYFEQAVTDALITSGIFSGVDDSKSAEVIMPMIRAKGSFSSIEYSGDTPYFLNIRITKVDTPSFSVRMTVSMDTIWTLYRTDEKIELLNEKIHSTYTGGFFEGGLHGANRVRVAMEGAMRESILVGMEKFEALDLDLE